MQPKLAVAPIDDPLEREADAVAEQVMRMPALPPSISAAAQQITRKCEAYEEDEKAQALQTKPAGIARPVGEAPAIVHEALRSPGQPLDPATRTFFEPRFGHEFSRVRVHSDAYAQQSARELSANAYTVGPHIVFASSRFAPWTHAGRRLIAHELTHVVQQSGALPIRDGKNNGNSGQRPVFPGSAVSIRESAHLSVQRDEGETPSGEQEAYYALSSGTIVS